MLSKLSIRSHNNATCPYIGSHSQPISTHMYVNTALVAAAQPSQAQPSQLRHIRQVGCGTAVTSAAPLRHIHHGCGTAVTGTSTNFGKATYSGKTVYCAVNATHWPCAGNAMQHAVPWHTSHNIVATPAAASTHCMCHSEPCSCVSLKEWCQWLRLPLAGVRPAAPTHS